MIKLIFAIWSILLLSSCGFQSRKYTRGYYGTALPSKHPTEISTPHAAVQSSLKTEYIEPTKDFGLSTFELTEQTTILKDELTQSKVQTIRTFSEISNSNNCVSDTLKLGLGMTQEEKLALQPPSEFHPLIKKRRWDFLALGISSIIMYLCGLEAFGYTSGLTGSIGIAIVLIVASILSMWFNIRSFRNMFKMRELMKSHHGQYKDSLWFSHLKFNNIISVIFSPFFLILMFMTALLLIIGLASFYGILFIS